MVPIPQAGVELSELEGESVLYHPERMTMMYLNESANIIWRLCDGRRTVASIIDTLAREFPEQANAVAIDVREAIDQFVREGVVELGEA